MLIPVVAVIAFLLGVGAGDGDETAQTELEEAVEASSAEVDDAVAERDAALAEAEDAEDAIARREQAVAERGEELDARELALDEREAQLDAREDALPAPEPPPAPDPEPAPPPAPRAPEGDCHASYSPCVPSASDVDCAGGSGDGPEYVQGPVDVIGPDEYRLDHDGDGVGCES